MGAFNALDETHTDGVHYSEFLAAMVSHRIALHNSLLVDTFRRFDTEGLGYLTTGTLQDLLGSCFTSEDVTLLMKEIDLNADGKISEAEFIQYLQGSDATDKHKDCAHMVIDSQLSPGGSHHENVWKKLGPRRLRAKTERVFAKLHTELS